PRRRPPDRSADSGRARRGGPGHPPADRVAPQRQRPGLRSAGRTGRRVEPPGRQRHLGVGLAGRSRGGVAAALRLRPPPGPHPRRMTSRRRVGWLTGAGVVAIYLGLAALSGHLSLFARRPMLDGGPGVIQPYRWVSPPPGLEKTNRRPLSRRVRPGLTARGS